MKSPASRLNNDDMVNGDIKGLMTGRRNNNLIANNTFGKRHYSTLEGIQLNAPQTTIARASSHAKSKLESTLPGVNGVRADHGLQSPR